MVSLTKTWDGHDDASWHSSLHRTQEHGAEQGTTTVEFESEDSTYQHTVILVRQMDRSQDTGAR